MNILYGINTTADFGIGYIAQKAVEGLKERGHNVTFAKPGKQVGDWEYDLVLCRSLKSLVDMGRKPDILHVWANHGYRTMRFASEQGIPTVLDRASTHVDHQNKVLSLERLRVMMEKAIPDNIVERMRLEYEHADIILVPSRFAFETFPDRLRYKIRVNPFGVDTARFYPKHVRERLPKMAVGFVGCNVRRKGFEYYLAALAEMKAEGYEVVARGALGDVKIADMPEIYNSLDVLCLPSLEEGNALCVAEAMACGVPVVVTRECGLWPDFIDGVYGIIVPAKDANAIKKALIRLTDRKERERMGGEGVELARRPEHSWQVYVKRLEEIYTRGAKV